MGRGLMVFIDIKVGDIVVVEKSYGLVNFLEREEEYCSYCSKRINVFVFC